MNKRERTNALWSTTIHLPIHPSTHLHLLIEIV